MKPLAIDLYCGLGGWTEGLLAEGYEVVGFDNEDHRYGEHRYPAQLVLQDVLTLHGSQFRDAVLIVASPPCQEFSYMAMPWSRAKVIAAEYRSGVRDVAKLTELFDACFRIQREASEAAGRFIPLVVENVRGAVPWVGRSRWNFGSFHLWGDVPALMPIVNRRAGNKIADDARTAGTQGWKLLKSCEFGPASGCGMNPDGRKAPGGTQWFNDGPRTPDSLASSGSKSSKRKAASAMIAKIPLALARHIAQVYRP